MELNDKLRKEIAHLSHLIGTSGTSTYNHRPAVTTTSATASGFQHRPPSTYKVTLHGSRRIVRKATVPPVSHIIYSQPKPHANPTFVNAPHSTSTSNPYRFSIPAVIPSTSLPRFTQVTSTVSVNPPAPSSVPTTSSTSKVFLNPAFFTSSNSNNSIASSSTTSTSTSTSSSFVVRPHFNPAFTSAPTVETEKTLPKITALPAIPPRAATPVVSPPPQLRPSLPPQSTNSLVITKHKLDRRPKKQSPKAVFKNLQLQKTLASSPLTSTTQKVVQRYSTRPRLLHGTVPQRKSPNRIFTLIKRKSLLNYKYNAVGSLPINGTAKKAGAIVNIDGSNYIAKNGGKSLKRVSLSRVSTTIAKRLKLGQHSSRKPNGYLNINGQWFAKKNGGRTLKRLSNSLTLTTAGVKPAQKRENRLANRAVAKSKLTLSQKSWKRKQLCAFYIRFGECKRKEDGTCPYLHDHKQITICPKFVAAGKCDTSDCKLSHDLKIGRMAPCQFYNKSKCSRENCPYPHVRSQHLKKNSSESSRDKNDDDQGKISKKKASPKKVLKGKSTTASRKRKRSESSKTKKSSAEDKDAKKRYYNESPDSQPLVSIIPRRCAHLVTSNKNPDITNNGNPDSEKVPKSDSSVSSLSSMETVESDSPPCQEKSRRSRLRNNISRLREKVQKKEAKSTAPEFLPF